jgi:mercuric ion binding protein
MKTISKNLKASMLSLFFVLLSTVSFGQKSITSQIQTNAQCGDCKERIEGKLNYTKGIKFAELDDQTKIVTVKFDPKKIDLLTIKQTIAKIGYDADEVKAAQEDIEKLPKCCQPNGH